MRCNRQGCTSGTTDEPVTVVLVDVTDDVTAPAVPKVALSDEGVNLSCLSPDGRETGCQVA